MLRVSPFLVLLLITHMSAALTVETGTLEGAPYKIVRAADANGPLLLLAHGYRPEHVPLTADFDHETAVMEGLLEAGWTIGSTGYRRNGWIDEEAVEDLLNLKKQVAALWGPPTETYFLGGSLGGLIITLMAERHGDEMSGAVAMGAALTKNGGAWRLPFTFAPKMPVIFLTNRSEIAGPRAYVEKATGSPNPPALWEVKRDGHVNLNFQEQEAALMAVVEWSRTGAIDREMDGTRATESRSVAVFDEGSAEAPVLRVHPIYGNLISAYIREDLEKLGIKHGERFQLTYEAETVQVLFGTTYGDVPRGDWVAFLDAEGYLMIVRNFADAGGTLCLEAGAILSISAIK